MEQQSKANPENPLTNNSVVQFLQSDVTLNIAIFFALVGMFVMAFFIYSLEGMARVHVSFVTFLFCGLFFSLLYFKSLKNSSELAGKPEEKQLQKGKEE